MRVALTLLLLCLATVPARAEFAIRDGDTVVFLGDSLTAARTYGKIIENYTLLRFPERKVRFINMGIGGDTATGGLARLERDVFQKKATVLTVAFGTNDIGWGVHADDEHKKKYLDAIRGIVEQCKKHGVRVYICSAAVTAEDPNKSEAGFLQKMCDEGMDVSRSLGEGAIDVQRSMRVVQKRIAAFNATLKDDKGKVSLHLADGAHLTDLGQLAMAFAILKGLGAPAEVSSATIDAAAPSLIEAKGCKVTDVAKSDGRVEFVRLDEGLPINFGLFGAINFRFIPIHTELNRYMLAVKGLPEGRYEVMAEDRLVATFTDKQLAAGVNIASLTSDPWQPGGPWDAQATLLKHLTDARSELTTSLFLARLYVPNSPKTRTLNEQAEEANVRIEEMQRALVKPMPYRFVIRSAKK